MAENKDEINLQERLANFKKVYNNIISQNTTSQNRYGDYWYRPRRKYIYTPEEVNEILEGTDVNSKQQLSKYFFEIDGLYRQIILYYATLLNYSWLVLPCGDTEKIKQKKIIKQYNSVLDFLNSSSIADLCTYWGLKILSEGIYYGIVIEVDNKLAIIDLPKAYCESNYKDLNGNDIIEFNLTYFDTFTNEEIRNNILNSYPRYISKAYKKWKKGKIESKIMLPSNMGVCFSIFDGSPLFVNTIPSTLQYKDAVGVEQERDLEEIKKIIVQKVPHIATTGELVFEPDEAEEMHKGAVGMMKGNPNVSVLTTYADVDAIVSKTTADASSNTIEKMLNNVYNSVGVSGQIFSLAGSSSLKSSMNKDLSIMMMIARKIANCITNVINDRYSSDKISFKFEILPIAEFNKSDYINDSMKLGSSGYSFLIPAIAQGVNQKDLITIKTIENDILKLPEVLIPLSTSYTQSGNGEGGGAGRPELDEEDKSEKTVKNEESINNQGGTE